MNLTNFSKQATQQLQHPKRYFYHFGESSLVLANAETVANNNYTVQTIAKRNEPRANEPMLYLNALLNPVQIGALLSSFLTPS
jgi:hypothetical protein